MRFTFGAFIFVIAILLMLTGIFMPVGVILLFVAEDLTDEV